MQMKLDDIELIKRVDKEGAIVEVRSINSLSVSGRRNIVELQIPGSTGNVFQDMGRNPIIISFDGEFVGPGSSATMQDLKSKFELKKPVPFTTDITTISDVTEVVIDSLSVNFMYEAPVGGRYSIVLREHKSASAPGEAGPGETTPPSQEESAKRDIELKASKIFKGVKSGS